MQCGEGKDLLFLHGYGANKESFLPQIKYFSKFYRVTAFDFTGFGKSPPLSEAWSVEDYANETERLIEELSLKKPSIVAHSFGARVAVKLAARPNAKNTLEKLILTGAAGINLNRGLLYRAKITAYRACKKFFPGYAEKHFGSAEYRVLTPIMRESYKKIVNEDLRGEAQKIVLPTLLIYGEKDDITPINVGMVYRSHIKNSQLKVMNGCGHFAFTDDPLTFQRLTEEFLEN